jgi:hypothetical protein
MAAYLLRITRPGCKPYDRPIKNAGLATALQGAHWETRGNTGIRAEVIVDGETTAVYVNGARTETVNSSETR